MNCEIIAVGSEITTGDVTNTNAAFLSGELTSLGVEVTCQTAVDDNPAHIVEALRAAVSRSHIIIFTGGLGPTQDDLTKETVFRAVGLPLEINADSKRRIENYFAAKGVPCPQSNMKQAMFPKSAVIFENKSGTADGCAVKSGSQCLILLPGPPGELVPMFDEVKSFLAEDFLGIKTYVKNIKAFGMGESEIAEKIAGIIDRKTPTVATYIEDGGDVRIKVSALGTDYDEIKSLCDKTAGEVMDLLGSAVYNDRGLHRQDVVVESLRARHLKISTAESCTAGLLSKMLTDVSGSSSVFEYGISAYANRIKNERLGVSEQLLERVGAVSAEVAEAMAKGAKKEGEADLGLGITGLAGPEGGTEQKPVGLVFICLYDGEKFFTKRLNLPENKGRDEIRLRSAMEALNMVRLYLERNGDFLLTGKKDNDVFSVRENFSKAPDPFAVQKPEQKFVKKEPVPVSKANTAPAKKKKKKKGGAKEIFRRIVMFISATVFLCSALYIGDYVYQGIKNKQEIDRLNGLYSGNGMLDENGVNTSFYQLLEQNPDTVGWINVPNTQVHNPVVKTSDNDKYLTTNFEGEKSKYGTVFADMNNVFEKGPVTSTNTILYAHHMKDGQMFGELKKYRDLDFYKENPVISFTTIYSPTTTRWKVFSVFIINTHRDDDNGNLFNYMRTEFSGESDFEEFIQNCYQRSIITTPVQDVTMSDKLLTLSTCVYDFDDARLVVVARQVRDGESESVDTSSAIINPDPVYPQVYRNRYGAGRTTVEYSVSPAAYEVYKKAAAAADTDRLTAYIKKSLVF